MSLVIYIFNKMLMFWTLNTNESICGGGEVRV